VTRWWVVVVARGVSWCADGLLTPAALVLDMAEGLSCEVRVG
jgi:hypothetical protein